MGKALDLTGFTVTAPGASGTGMTAFTGDPSAVRNGVPGSSVKLLGAWTKSQAAGSTAIVFPSGNDTSRNINYINVANQPGNKLDRYSFQPMKPQDALTITEIGSAVAGDVELCHLLQFYDDLPGIDAALISPDELAQRMVRKVTVRGSITATAAGAWSGATAISAITNFLRGNTQYAIIGASVGATCGALAINGPSTGGLHVGLPGLTSPDKDMVNFFAELSEWAGLPLIPTFNSADNTGTFISISQDENLAAVPFSLNLAELAGV